jgi:putative hydrolase of the HAD superfamily
LTDDAKQFMYEHKGETMVNTVVFDIGNVLIDFRWQGLFEDLGFTGEKFEAIANATVRS